jgi:hypothetical protein
LHVGIIHKITDVYADNRCKPRYLNINPDT